MKVEDATGYVTVEIGTVAESGIFGDAVWPGPGPVPVPEPSSLAIFALGIIGLALRRFKKES
jgi:hypothetical protein